MPRFRQVREWLTTRLTVEQAEQHYTDLDRNGLTAFGKPGGWLSYFRGRLLSQMEAGDELWWYDSGQESWEQLGGEMGIALVRSGKVVGFMMEMMN